MKAIIKQSFSVNYSYDVYFTHDLFSIDNLILRQVIKKAHGGPAKVIVLMDERIAQKNPGIIDKIKNYAIKNNDVINLVEDPICIPGDEGVKNNIKLLRSLYEHINEDAICRHSYIVAIGGGALLDAVGFIAATAHRGIRLIRVPTTVLSQDDSGVGVKNGFNYFGKKNYIGTFAPPYAVLNDFMFLKSLSIRDWLSGMGEAVKVSLIKDADFFHYISANAEKLIATKDESIMENIICRSAELHLLHIGTQGDPFEMGSSRPLDFGHWSAHKLEQITNHRLRHGEAVAIGVALDSTYSYLNGMLPEADWQIIMDTMRKLQFTLYVPELSQYITEPEHNDNIFKGMIEFREHLGGELTLMMLNKIGHGIEVHSVDFDLYRNAIDYLKDFHEKNPPKKLLD